MTLLYTDQCCYPGLDEFWCHPWEEQPEGRATHARQYCGRKLAAKHITQLQKK